MVSRKEENKFLQSITDKFQSFVGTFEKPFSNISQNIKKSTIIVELPHVQDKDLTIIINNDLVIIKATRGKEKTLNYTIFYRKIPLPAGLDIQKTKKTFQRGTLTLEIPHERL
ncbi:MAG TPA: Hsp20/alpha crystallin family protein [Candidatus Nanoarchaeia archaeon]|nr:Hsp20/alpha crystallin family protein [Candidatus Nanoarchaeia archaeon]